MAKGKAAKPKKAEAEELGLEPVVSRSEVQTKITQYKGIKLFKVITDTTAARNGSLKYRCHFLTITRSQIVVSSGIREGVGLDIGDRFDLYFPEAGTTNDQGKPFVVMQIHEEGTFIFRQGTISKVKDTRYSLISSSKFSREALGTLGSKKAIKQGSVHVKMQLIERGKGEVIYELTGLN